MVGVDVHRVLGDSDMGRATIVCCEWHGQRAASLVCLGMQGEPFAVVLLRAECTVARSSEGGLPGETAAPIMYSTRTSLGLLASSPGE